MFLPREIIQAAYQDVIFSEIAWMGNQESSNNEWIELYNNTAVELNLNGWKILAENGTPSIALEGKILPKSCYLIERTNDDSALAPSQQVYTGALENNGETLKLFNNTGNLIDKVDAKNNWPAGDNTGKLTMERGLPFNEYRWHNSSTPEGNPGTYAPIYQSITVSPSITLNSQKQIESLTLEDKNLKNKLKPEQTAFIGLLIAGISGIIIVSLRKLIY